MDSFDAIASARSDEEREVLIQAYLRDNPDMVAQGRDVISQIAVYLRNARGLIGHLQTLDIDTASLKKHLDASVSDVATIYETIESIADSGYDNTAKDFSDWTTHSEKTRKPNERYDWESGEFVED